MITTGRDCGRPSGSTNVYLLHEELVAIITLVIYNTVKYNILNHGINLEIYLVIRLFQDKK